MNIFTERRVQRRTRDPSMGRKAERDALVALAPYYAVCGNIIPEKELHSV